MKAKRLEILKQIDALDEKRCKKCHADSEKRVLLCNCKSAKAVRKLGDELISLGVGRVEHLIEELIKEGFDNLSVDKYQKVKQLGVSDTDIYKLLKVGSTRWFEWKRSVGLTRETKEKELI